MIGHITQPLLRTLPVRDVLGDAYNALDLIATTDNGPGEQDRDRFSLLGPDGFFFMADKISVDKILNPRLLEHIFIGVVVYQNGKEAIRRSLGDNFYKIAHEKIHQIENRLHKVYVDVGTWANLGLMQEVITGDLDGRITSFLMELERDYGSYSSLLVVDPKGLAVAASNPELIGRKFPLEEFYLKNMAGEVYVGDLSPDAVDREWVMTFSFPIKAKFDKEQVIGMLAAKWRGKELSQIIQFEKEAGDSQVRAVLIRNDGLVIHAPDELEAGLFKRNVMEEGYRAAILALRGGGGYLIAAGPEGQDRLIGFDHLEGTQDFPSMGWGVLVSQDTEIVFAPIERLRRFVFRVAAIVSLLVIVISIVITRRMTLPILNVSKAAARVAKGE